MVIRNFIHNTWRLSGTHEVYDLTSQGDNFRIFYQSEEKNKELKRRQYDKRGWFHGQYIMDKIPNRGTEIQVVYNNLLQDKYIAILLGKHGKFYSSNRTNHTKTAFLIMEIVAQGDF